MAKQFFTMFFIIIITNICFGNYDQLELPAHSGNVIFTDINNDGLDDLYTLNIMEVNIFVNKPGKGYGAAKDVSGIKSPDYIVKLPKKATVHLIDMDGDGLREIVAVGSYNIAVFKNMGPKGFAEKPDSLFKTNREVKIVSIQDIDNDKKCDLISFASKEITVNKGDGINFSKDSKIIHKTGIVFPENLYILPSSMPFLRNYVVDLDSKQPVDLFVPSSTGSSVLLRDGDKSEVKELKIPWYTVFGPSNTIDRIKRLSVAIFVPDVQKVENKNETDYIVKNSGESYSLKKAMTGERDYVSLEKHDNQFEYFNTATSLPFGMDINGDDTADQISVEDKYSLSGKTTTILFYRCDPETGEFIFRDKDGEPSITARLSDTNILSSPIMRDFNGDKKIDVAMLNADLGLTEFENIIKQQAGNIEAVLNFYYLKGDKNEAYWESSFKKKIRFNFNLHLLSFITGETGIEKFMSTFVNMEGNFGGDSTKDLLVRPTDDVIEVYFLRKNDKPFDDKPNMVFKGLPVFSYYNFFDFNNDGLTDIVVRGKKDKKHIRMLIISGDSK